MLTNTINYTLVTEFGQRPYKTNFYIVHFNYIDIVDYIYIYIKHIVKWILLWLKPSDFTVVLFKRIKLTRQKLMAISNNSKQAAHKKNITEMKNWKQRNGSLYTQPSLWCSLSSTLEFINFASQSPSKGSVTMWTKQINERKRFPPQIFSTSHSIELSFGF